MGDTHCQFPGPGRTRLGDRPLATEGRRPSPARVFASLERVRCSGSERQEREPTRALPAADSDAPTADTRHDHDRGEVPAPSRYREPLPEPTDPVEPLPDQGDCGRGAADVPKDLRSVGAGDATAGSDQYPVRLRLPRPLAPLRPRVRLRCGLFIPRRGGGSRRGRRRRVCGGSASARARIRSG